MHFYYFMKKRYDSAYEQARCIYRFAAMILPVAVLIVFLRHSLPAVFHIVLFLTGWCTWTFIEYILHRFWMHDKDSNSTIAQTHHYHHTHPTEMVVTNVHRLLMLAIVIVLVLIAIRVQDYFTLLPGFAFGAVGFFWMHQFLHLKISQRIFRRLVRYHIYHHCKYPNTCYGVSVPWWDDLFKTVPTDPRLTERILDFYFTGNANTKESVLRNDATMNKSSVSMKKNCDRDCATCRANC